MLGVARSASLSEGDVAVCESSVEPKSMSRSVHAARGLLGVSLIAKDLDGSEERSERIFDLPTSYECEILL